MGSPFLFFGGADIFLFGTFTSSKNLALLWMSAAVVANHTCFTTSPRFGSLTDMLDPVKERPLYP
jgi:hypothetical protein